MNNVLENLDKELVSRLGCFDPEQRGTEVQRAEIDDFIALGKLRQEYEKLKLEGDHKLRIDESDERIKMRQLELEHEYKMAELSVREKEIELSIAIRRDELINASAEKEAKLIVERINGRSEFTKTLMSSVVQFAVPVIGVIGTRNLWEEFVPVLLEFETNNSVNSFVSKQLLTFPKIFGRK